MTPRTLYVLPLAALLTFGAAPARMPLAPQVGERDLSTLSLNDRLNLPAETKVKFGKFTTTLGALRANHAALVASRNRVQRMTFAKLTEFAGANHTFTGSFGSSPPHLVPIRMATPSPGVQPVSTSGYAADYRQFCKSVTATVCLYYPAGVTWYGQDQNGNYQTIDTLITDPNVCAQEGGTIGSLNYGAYVANAYSGCIYTYPSAQSVNFLPPNGGFTTQGWCDGASGHFSMQNDPHGAVKLADAGASGFYQGSWGSPDGGSTGSLQQFCFIQVKLQ